MTMPVPVQPKAHALPATLYKRTPRPWWKRWLLRFSGQRVTAAIQALGAIASTAAILYGVGSYLYNQPQTQAQAKLQAHLTAWQIIDVAQGQSAGGVACYWAAAVRGSSVPVSRRATRWPTCPNAYAR